MKSYITTDPEIMGGEPCIRGTRITARSVAARVEAGDTLDDLAADYPDVTYAAFVEAAIEGTRLLFRDSADKVLAMLDELPDQ